MDNEAFIKIAKPGDVLLYRADDEKKVGFILWLVGWGQRVLGDQKGAAAYSHAQLYTGNGQEVEATWPRIRETLVDTARVGLEIWRLKKPPTDPQVSAAIGFARNKIGLHYDIGYILSFGKVQSKHEYVCSELVVASLKAAGLNILGDNDPLQSPDDIAQSSVMERIA